MGALILRSKGVEETEELGSWLGRALKLGDLVLLYGELGAGKTAFTRGIGRGIGLRSRILSPTFLGVREYPLGDGKLFHCDLYRSGSGDALGEFGVIDELYDQRAIAVVEWSEYLSGGEVELLDPSRVISVTIEVDDDLVARKIRVSSVRDLDNLDETRAKGDEPESVILGIDTSREKTIVTLGRREQVIFESLSPGQAHLEALGPMVHGALRGGDVQHPLASVGVVCGPGGFAGLRVGVSFASVYASLKMVKVIELSSFDLLVDGVMTMDVGDHCAPRYVLGILDAKRGEVFYELSTRCQDLPREILGSGHCRPHDLWPRLLPLIDGEELPHVAVVGDGLSRYSEALALPEVLQRVEIDESQLPTILARAAYRRYVAGLVTSPAEVKVAYFRGADAKARVASQL